MFIGDARGELTCYDKAFTWQPDSLWPGSTEVRGQVSGPPSAVPTAKTVHGCGSI